MSGRVSPAFAFTVACVGIANFSCMDAVMKGQSLALGAYNAMLWRSVAGTVISGLVYLARREPWPDRASLIVNIKRSVAAGCSVLLFFWGLVRVPMAEGVALTFLAPVIAILLAVPMLGERIRPRALIACAVAFLGVLVIVAGKAEAGGGEQALAGQLAIVLASIFYAYNLVQLRASAQASGPIVITFITNIVFLALYALAAPVLAVVPDEHHFAPIALAAALATASSLALAWAYAHAETQVLVPVEYTAFVWASILGAIVFGERVLPMTILGAAMIIAGALISARGGKGPVTEAAA